MDVVAFSLSVTNIQFHLDRAARLTGILLPDGALLGRPNWLTALLPLVRSDCDLERFKLPLFTTDPSLCCRDKGRELRRDERKTINVTAEQPSKPDHQFQPAQHKYPVGCADSPSSINGCSPSIMIATR